MSSGITQSTHTPNSEPEAQAMAEAQRELYALLGISARELGNTRSLTRRRPLSSDSPFTRARSNTSPISRPASLPPTPGLYNAFDNDVSVPSLPSRT